MFSSLLTCKCTCTFKDTLLDLLCESMVSTVRQGKGFLVCGFPGDLRQAEDYEAKVSQGVVTREGTGGRIPGLWIPERSETSGGLQGQGQSGCGNEEGDQRRWGQGKGFLVCRFLGI